MDDDAHTSVSEFRAFADMGLVGDLAVVNQEDEQRDELREQRDVVEIEPPREAIKMDSVEHEVLFLRMNVGGKEDMLLLQTGYFFGKSLETEFVLRLFQQPFQPVATGETLGMAHENVSVARQAGGFAQETLVEGG